MLLEHVSFLAHINPGAAKKLHSEIMRNIRSLETMPKRYPYLEPENPRNPYRKLFVPNWYLVLYMVDNVDIYVEYVLDCRQDYKWLLP